MTFTRPKSLVLSIAVALWVPASLFVNPGWFGTILLLAPQVWMFVFFALPLLVPIASLLTRGNIPKLDRRLQISFYICWALLGIFLVDGGDTLESTRSIASNLLVGIFDRRVLNTLSMYIWVGLLFSCLVLLITITVRAIINRLSVKNEQRTISGKDTSRRSLVISGIVSGGMLSVFSLSVGPIIAPFVGNDVGLAAVWSLGLPVVIATAISFAMISRLKQPAALATSLLGFAIIELIVVGARVLDAQRDMINHYYIPSTPTVLGYIVLAIPVVIAPFILWGVGYVLAKRQHFGTLASIVGACFIAGGLLFTYSFSNQILTKNEESIQKTTTAAIDFTIFEPTYLPADPPLVVRRIHPYAPDTRVGAHLELEYSTFTRYSNGPIDPDNYTAYSFSEYNKAQLPSNELGPDCNSSSSHQIVPVVCKYAGTSMSGAKIFFVISPETKVIYGTVINIENTRIFIGSSPLHRMNLAEAIKIADGLREVDPADMTTIDR